MVTKLAITDRQGPKTGFIDNTNLRKIISGGQTGADQGGLFAGRDLGLATGGRIPKGFLTERGFETWLKDYGLVETDDVDYPHRTIQNIKESDATVLFSGRFMERGVSLTFNTATRLQKPIVRISIEAMETSRGWALELDKARGWFNTQWKVLNIAGPRESKEPGIQELAHNFMLRFLIHPRLKEEYFRGVRS